MKLSIITVSFNSEKTIESTIKSVISQKNDDIEYLIVDGGSTDGTRNIIEKYIDKIDVFISEPDRGISDAFNKGIKLAKGSIIGIINSDDEYIDGAFEMLLNEIKPQTEVLYGNGIRRFSDGTAKKVIVADNIDELMYGMPLLHPSVFVRKKAYDKYGCFDEKYKSNMDRELLLRMYLSGAVFQRSKRYYSIYSMGGMSDKNYYKSVLPESYNINIKYGMKKYKALLIITRSFFMHFALKIRNDVIGDKKRVSFARLLSDVENENNS